MNEIELIPARSSDRWAYGVSFLGPTTNPYGGAVPELRIPVLMMARLSRPVYRV
jgi:hypothetical protein